MRLGGKWFSSDRRVIGWLFGNTTSCFSADSTTQGTLVRSFRQKLAAFNFNLTFSASELPQRSMVVRHAGVQMEAGHDEG